MSLSLLEGESFRAPIMQLASRNSAVEGILKDIAGMRVGYDREMTGDGSGMILVERGADRD